MKQAIEIPCEDCKKIRLVKTNGMLLESYIKINPVCRSCGAMRVKDKISKSWFKKGQTSWNKGIKKPTNSGKTWFKKGEHISKETEFNSKNTLGSKNIKWKGKEVGYHALHAWVKRKLGKASKCSECGSIVNVQWANISRKYKRNKKDWKELCYKCHRKFDSGENWGKASKLFKIGNKYANRN